LVSLSRRLAARASAVAARALGLQLRRLDAAFHLGDLRQQVLLIEAENLLVALHMLAVDCGDFDDAPVDLRAQLRGKHRAQAANRDNLLRNRGGAHFHRRNFLLPFVAKEPRAHVLPDHVRAPAEAADHHQHEHGAQDDFGPAGGLDGVGHEFWKTARNCCGNTSREDSASRKAGNRAPRALTSKRC
jgi:hypothetical protein